MTSSNKITWTNYQKTTLALAIISAFLNPFLLSSINVALPSINQDFNLKAITLSWIITSFLLSSAIFLLPLGKIADTIGIKKIFSLGIIVFTTTTFLCGFSFSGHHLIALRFLQGIGGAMTMTTSPAILVSAFSQKHRGRVLGISTSAVYIGLATGPFIGGFLTQHLGWRSVFFITTVIGIFSIIITLKYLGKDTPTNQKINIRPTSVLLYVSALVLLVYGASIIPKTQGWGLLIGGFILLITYILYEKNNTTPLIDIALFAKNRLFAFSNVAALINYSATYAIVFILSFYLQKIKLFTPQEAGMILLIQPILMASISPIAGRLSDKVQARFLSSLGMSFCALGLFLFSFLNESSSLIFIAFTLVIVGIGFGFFSSPNMNTIMSSVQKTQYGIASGVSASMRVIGQIVSMTIVTFFIAYYLGDVNIMEVNNHIFIKTIHVVFMVFGIIASVGIYFSLARGKLQK